MMLSVCILLSLSCQTNEIPKHSEPSLDIKDASRFLSQATLGANFEDIEHLQSIGINSWLEKQFTLREKSFLDTYTYIYKDIKRQIKKIYGDMPKPFPRRSRHKDYFQYTFYQKILKDKDQLRHKVALSLSQIFVSSFSNAVLEYRGYGNSSYYDIFYLGSFGNFRDLLQQITLHPVMGSYLSHYNNSKGDPKLGTFPDENFAREVMQLFTIGLIELNNDGTPKLDANQEKIPTYDIEDVQELAKVFTGLSGGAWNLEFMPQHKGKPLEYGNYHNHYLMTHPMKMYNHQHEPGPKRMIDGTVIPEGQDGMKDIEMALDVLFNHPNVGPFICRLLIQHMVKSNPTPAYIDRVASVFNNNGNGVRGDMQAVVRAILTDSEARDSSWIRHPQTGKLRQPIERLSHLFRAFDIESPSGKLWFRDLEVLGDELGQSIFASKSVFNFFSPFYAVDLAAANDMISPEFEILNDASSIAYLNIIEEAIKAQPFKNLTTVNSEETAATSTLELLNNESDKPYLNFEDELELFQSNGLDALIDRLDLILSNGQLSERTRQIITDSISKLVSHDNQYSESDIINDVLYFIMISPDYLILK